MTTRDLVRRTGERRRTAVEIDGQKWPIQSLTGAEAAAFLNRKNATPAPGPMDLILDLLPMALVNEDGSMAYPADDREAAAKELAMLPIATLSALFEGVLEFSQLSKSRGETNEKNSPAAR